MAARLVALGALAALCASAGATHYGAASWQELSYPVGDEKQYVRTSGNVHLENIGEVDISYHWLYRTGHNIGEPLPSHRPRARDRCSALAGHGRVAEGGVRGYRPRCTLASCGQFLGNF